VERVAGLRIVCFLLQLVLFNFSFAQETTVKGKVTDANSGDPIPFAAVIFQGSSVGTSTDFDGNYSIKTTRATDSVKVTNIGYKSKSKFVKVGISQVINIQIEEAVGNLDEVTIHAGENPAYEVLRNVQRNKDKNDKRKLTAYEYDTYTKIEIDVDNISEQFRKRKIVQKIEAVLDSVDRIAGEDGKPILPLLITESVSRLYYRDNPSLKKEEIQKTKITGVGVEDGTTVTQLIGSSFQEYNFYQNWLDIVTKDFVSPIADVWRLYYEYDLTDSVYVGSDFCYQLDFTPKSKQDLAFTGTMWITKNEYALKRIDASISGSANVNFIEKLKIQQELAKTELGQWLPVKNRVLIDISEIRKNTAGMLAKFYTTNKNVVVNQPKPPKFYERPIVTAEGYRENEDDKVWDSLRHEPLSEAEKNVYQMIDTLNNIPIVKAYSDIIKIVMDGYYNMGKYELGSYLSVLAWNNIEGVRLQGGFKTTLSFSKKWIYYGNLAYGFKDQRVKYYASAQRIISKEKWTTLSFRARSDVSRVGVDEEALADNPLFLSALRWGNFRRGFYFNEARVAFERQLFKGFAQKVSARYMTFNPQYNFGYPENPDDVNSAVLERFETTEVSVESRYGRDELFITNDNERYSLGADKWPIISLRYTHGFKGVMGSDFDYDKLRLTINKKFQTGPLGKGYLTFTAENIFNTLPYPLLAFHLGNQSFLYSSVTYNLMNYGEFISDHYVAMQYRQYFEGFLINRVPLLNKLKWRLLATGSVISGGMREANRNMISKYTNDGEETLTAGYLTGKPYMELGYGVENIFKFLRVDFVHRLTYLDRPDVRTFGVLFTAQFQL
jgi:hypothetical protein